MRPPGLTSAEGPIERHPLDCLVWNEAGRCWLGLVEVNPGWQIEVAVRARRRDPKLALAYARLAFPLIQPRIDEARAFAARRLLRYYNYFNAHLREGEQLSEADFAGRLELEAVWFNEKGGSMLYFRHSLYRGYRGLEGGQVVVMARFDGEFRKAAWVSAADAEEWRRTRRGT